MNLNYVNIADRSNDQDHRNTTLTNDLLFDQSSRYSETKDGRSGENDWAVHMVDLESMPIHRSVANDKIYQEQLQEFKSHQHSYDVVLTSDLVFIDSKFIWNIGRLDHGSIQKINTCRVGYKTYVLRKEVEHESIIQYNNHFPKYLRPIFKTFIFGNIHLGYEFCGWTLVDGSTFLDNLSNDLNLLEQQGFYHNDLHWRNVTCTGNLIDPGRLLRVPLRSDWEDYKNDFQDLTCTKFYKLLNARRDTVNFDYHDHKSNFIGSMVAIIRCLILVIGSSLISISYEDRTKFGGLMTIPLMIIIIYLKPMRAILLGIICGIHISLYCVSIIIWQVGFNDIRILWITPLLILIGLLLINWKEIIGELMAWRIDRLLNKKTYGLLVD